MSVGGIHDFGVLEYVIYAIVGDGDIRADSFWYDMACTYHD